MSGSPVQQGFSQPGSTGPPQLPPTGTSSHFYTQPPAPIGSLSNNHSTSSLPASRPVFGISLDDLLKRDGSAVPLVVYQCIQAVDLFGLEVEGIYRLSGSSASVHKLKSIFDNGKTVSPTPTFEADPSTDPNQVDFRNPESFFHDVNSVAGLLKQFFRDLPDPLLTQEHYQDFVEAARKSSCRTL